MAGASQIKFKEFLTVLGMVQITSNQGSCRQAVFDLLQLDPAQIVMISSSEDGRSDRDDPFAPRTVISVQVTMKEGTKI